MDIRADAARKRVAALEDELRRLRAQMAESEVRHACDLAHLALVYETVPAGLCVLDTELRYVRVNERLAQMNGVPAEAHLGKRFREIIPDVLDEAEPLLRRVLETGEPLVGVEWSAVSPANPALGRFWTSQYWPLKNPSGQVLGVHVVVEELTQQKQLEETLKREYEFRTLAENSTDGIVRYDRALRHVYANRAIEDLLGLPRDKMLGKTNHELGLSPDIAHTWDAYLRQAFASQHESTVESWFRTPKGRRYLQSRLIPEFNASGEVETLLGITRDNTASKQIEEALRASEAQFRRVVDLVPDILYRSELPGYRTTFISPALESMLGFTPEEWEAQPELWLRQVHAEDRDRAVAEAAAATATGNRFLLRYRMWHKDGQTLRWLEDRAYIDRDVAGKATVFGVVSDITDRVRAEEAIQRCEQEFRALAERSPDVVARLDHDLRFQYINPVIESIWGRPPRFFLNKTLFDLALPPDVESAWVQNTRAVLSTGEDRRFVATYRSPDGRNRTFDTRLVPEFGEGAVKSAISVTREITRQHEAEEMLKRTMKQLEAANSLLEAQSRTDSLTGLANRRYLFDYMESEWRRETRRDQPISLIIADIDFFKAYNDYLGHLAGDDCLRRVADVLRAQVRRPGDLLARYGGEEFVVVLPETPVTGARELAEAMRQAIAKLQMEHAHSGVGQYVTISLGVAELSPRGHRADELFTLADAALYRAKASGRNMVVVAA